MGAERRIYLQWQGAARKKTRWKGNWTKAVEGSEARREIEDGWQGSGRPSKRGGDRGGGRGRRDRERGEGPEAWEGRTRAEVRRG